MRYMKDVERKEKLICELNKAARRIRNERPEEAERLEEMA